MTTRNTPSKPRAAPGDELELGFTDLLSNGQAVGRSNGLVIFCFGPLPRERARVRITTVKPTYCVAELIELVLRSPFRAQPFCPVFGSCGGCQLQHLAYRAQLGWKQDVVRNALTRIGGFAEIAVRDPIGMINPRNYRNKMSLVVDRDGAYTSFGFYKQRSHEVVPISACPIVLPQLNAEIGRLNELKMQANGDAIFAGVRHVVARAAKATEQSVTTFTTQTPSPALQEHGYEVLRALPGAVGLGNSFEPSSANAILGRKMRTVAGVAEIEEQIRGVRYRVSAASFFQINVEIVGRIFDFMRPGFDAPRRVVDLYCGAGTFALYFASLGSTVYGIEESPQAIAEAESNAALNALGERVTFRSGRVEHLAGTGEGFAAMRNAQIVFLDPPRKGSDEATLTAIARSGVPNVWYLSCDPATLARDLKVLAANGYSVGVVQPFDMFPHTGHVETLVTLYRTSAMREQIVAQAFKDVPVPAWPDDAPAEALPQEYPDFVIRE